MNVLLVEDDDLQRKMIQRFLEKSDYVVQSTTTVEDALTLIENHCYAAAVIDLNLGIESGLVLVRTIAAKRLATKVIIYTGQTDFAAAKEGIDLGVFAYVEKSLGLANLAEKLDRAASKYLEESLQRAEREIQLQIRLLDSVQDGVIATNRKFGIIYSNRIAQSWLGYDEAQINGKNALSMFSFINHSEPSGRLGMRIRQAVANEKHRWESEVQLLAASDSKDRIGDVNSGRIVRMTVSQILQSDSVFVGYVFILSDLTEQKQAEAEQEKMRQIATHAQRVSTVGQMAGVLAHEVNQPLGAISNYAGGLLLGLDSNNLTNDELRSMLQQIQQQAIRASAVISRLRVFTSQKAITKTKVDIFQLVLDALKLMEGDLRSHRVTLDLKMDKVAEAIEGDPIQLTQIIVNGIKNAAESVDLGNAVDRVLTILVQEHDENVSIAVIDRGPGMPPELTHRLFEPYFTTKTNGMGLGLSISKTIAASHQGKLTITPQQPCGMKFELILPKCSSLN